MTDTVTVCQCNHWHTVIMLLLSQSVGLQNEQFSFCVCGGLKHENLVPNESKLPLPHNSKADGLNNRH